MLRWPRLLGNAVGKAADVALDRSILVCGERLDDGFVVVAHIAAADDEELVAAVELLQVGAVGFHVLDKDAAARARWQPLKDQAKAAGGVSAHRHADDVAC